MLTRFVVPTMRSCRRSCLTTTKKKRCRSSIGGKKERKILFWATKTSWFRRKPLFIAQTTLQLRALPGDLWSSFYALKIVMFTTRVGGGGSCRAVTHIFKYFAWTGVSVMQEKICQAMTLSKTLLWMCSLWNAVLFWPEHMLRLHSQPAHFLNFRVNR